MRSGVAREHHGGCGRRRQTAENAQHRRPVAGADEAQRHVAGQREAGNQHHHPPYLTRVDGVVRPEVLVGQNRQDDQREHRELQDRIDVTCRHALADVAQLGLEVEQDGRRDREHDRQRRVAEPDGGAEAVGDDDRRFRSEAAILLLLPRREVGGDHGDGDDQQPGHQRPRAAGLLAEQCEQAAEHRHQREGAQAGRRIGTALALHADQQADPQRRGEGLYGYGQFRGDKAHGFSFCGLY